MQEKYDYVEFDFPDEESFTTFKRLFLRMQACLTDSAKEWFTQVFDFQSEAGTLSRQVQPGDIKS